MTYHAHDTRQVPADDDDDEEEEMCWIIERRRLELRGMSLTVTKMAEKTVVPAHVTIILLLFTATAVLLSMTSFCALCDVD